MIATITRTAPIAIGLRHRELCVGVWFMLMTTWILRRQFSCVSGTSHAARVTMIAR
jgi:hypothetical protein